MTSFSIEAQIRAKDEDCKHLRKERKLPGVVYGRKQEAISLTLDASEFLKLFRKTWESNIIKLKVWKKNIDVLVHQYQKEPVSWDFIHIDFFAITKGEKLKTMVSLNFIWSSEAVKEGAILEELTKEIEISCLPQDLIDHIDIDLTVLKEFDSHIKVSNIKVPDTIEILSPMDEVIVLAAKPKKVEEISDEAPESNLPTEDEAEKEETEKK